jgi:hypothetical protein
MRFAGLFTGLRTRMLLTLAPVSHLLFMGISDAIVYRRILGQVRGCALFYHFIFSFYFSHFAVDFQR